MQNLAEKIKKICLKLIFSMKHGSSNYRLVLAENRDEAFEKCVKYMKNYTNENLSYGIVENIDGKLIF